MAIVHLQLFGGLRISNAVGNAIDLRVKKVKAMLAYLAVEPETCFSREQIAQIFWPNTKNKQSRHSLRQALAYLRKHLPDFEQVFNITHNKIHIVPGSISVDVINFSDAAKLHDLLSQEKAYQLYRGQFIEGFNIRSNAFSAWCEETSSYLYQRYIQVVEFLAEHTLLQGETEKSIELNTKLIQLDPIRESAYCCLMSLHAREGHLEAVEDDYKQCCNMIQQKLNTTPEEQTVRYYQRIKQQLSDTSEPEEIDTAKIDTVKIDAEKTGTTNRYSVNHIPPTQTGREKGLSKIAALLEHHEKNKQGHCILITGESGIGKSWLLEQSGEIAENLGLNIACSRFFDVKYNHENGIRDLLSEIAKPEPALPNSELPDIIASRFFKDSVKHDIYLAILYIIYDLPVPKRLQIKYSALNTRSREQLHTRVIVDILSRVAVHGKQVLIFDDIDLAMPRAFSILSSLVQLTATQDLFLILSCKQSAPFPEHVIHESHLTTLTLKKLSVSELRQIFPLRFGEHDKNMVYLSWAAHLEKCGILDYADNLNSVLKRYASQLDNHDQLALQACAILGMRFSLDVLKSIIDDPHFDPARLIEAGLLIQNKHTLEFTHLLTQQCLYKQIAKDRRKSLHSLAASYYLFGNSHLHACHLQASGKKGTTKAYIAAAIVARDEFRLDFATYFFEKAFECARNKQDKYFTAIQKGEMLLGSERVSNAIQSFEMAQHLTNDPQQQARAWLGMAIGLIQRQQFLAAKGLLDRSESILAMNSSDNNSDYKNTDHKSLARFYYHRALTALHTDSTDDASRFNKIAFEHARLCQSSYWQTNIVLLSGNTELNNLLLADARCNFELAARIARENNHGNLELKALLSLAKVKLLQADFTDGVKDLEHVLSLASVVEDHHIVLDIVSVLCLSDFYKGQFSRLQRHTGLASVLCKIIDSPLKNNHISNYRLLSTYHLGRHEDVKKLVAHNYSLLSDPQGNQHQSWNLAPIMALIEEQAENAALYLDSALKIIDDLTGPDKLECCFISIEAAIKHKLWDHADNFADAVIMALQGELLPFFVMCAERVRILSRIDQGQINHTTRAELVDILTSAQRYGLTIHLPAYEIALEALRHHTEIIPP